MGLDMYLFETKYLGHYGFQKESENPRMVSEYEMAETVANIGTFVNPLYEDGGFVEAKICIYKWRKANQIHRWFVEYVQNDKDDCQSYEVTVENLEELVGVCKEALEAGPDEAGSILPPGSGFFFGGTTIDEWYLSQIEETIKGLEPIIARSKEADDSVWFEYQSSW